MKKNVTAITSILVIFLCTSFSYGQIGVGDVAPDFTISTTDGKPTSLYQLKGKMVILDFWASWCGPCRAANPEMIKIYNQYHPLGLEIYSVSLDSKVEPWIKAIEKDGLPWKYHGSDLKGWEAMPAMLYSINEVPTSIILDKNMIVQHRTYDMKLVAAKIKEIYTTRINVYPLQTSGKLYFSTKVKFDIKDASGNIVLQGREEAVDLSVLKDGKFTVDFDNRTETIEKIAEKSSSEIPVVVPNTSVSFTNPQSLSLYTSNGVLIKSVTDKTISIADLPIAKYKLELDGKLIEINKQ